MGRRRRLSRCDCRHRGRDRRARAAATVGVGASACRAAPGSGAAGPRAPLVRMEARRPSPRRARGQRARHRAWRTGARDGAGAPRRGHGARRRRCRQCRLEYERPAEPQSGTAGASAGPPLDAGFVARRARTVARGTRRVARGGPRPVARRPRGPSGQGEPRDLRAAEHRRSHSRLPAPHREQRRDRRDARRHQPDVLP